MTRALAAIALLVASNAFMTFAWYFHLTKKGWPLLLAIALSWLIALPEYILQVPANRLGHANFGGPFSAPQLKILQEAITLIVFTVFTLLILKEQPRPRDFVAMLLIVVAVAIAMTGPKRAPLAPAPVVETTETPA
ncbi:MAG: DMT family protein [Phycisphaeraceae bacterium]|nr:DMT family protein [Phycisphaeraceae bacterium]